ncbi:MAG TPA: chemotaxis response regulator protein-glutamate methylesterase [Polyangiales bacterium]|nr:chemotaxis response regulator protein-glutamate methylesterase [Polyangiales bacterium]
MNAPIRVMIVDDSAVVRKLLTSALAAHPEITVVGSAQNGLIALNKLPQLLPDAVILDVEMPEMDGITACARIRESYPRLPVIMFSTLTQRGASVTFDALAAGASDYVLKPTGQPGDSLELVVTRSLVPKLIALTRSRPALKAALSLLNEPKPSAFDPPTGSNRPLLRARSSTPSLLARPSMASLRAPEPAKLSQRPDALRSGNLPGPRKPVQVIAIACSTGGPNALAEVVPRFPLQLPVPVVIVQHMPPLFTRTLAERLALRSALKVTESDGGELMRAGQVFIAPGNRHLEVQQDERGPCTLLTDAPPENSCRPSADVLFRSLVRVYGGGVLAVVLTGMGNDGARGAREVADAGGRVIVQSGPTCVVWGMPRAVEEAGIASAVVPLAEMAGAILQQIGSGLLFPRHVESEP